MGGGRPTSPLSVFTCIDMEVPAGGGDRSGLPSAFYTDEITLCVSLRLLFSPGGCLRILSPSAQTGALENCHPESCGPWSLGHDGHELLSFFTVTHSAEKKIPNQTSPRGGPTFLRGGRLERDTCYTLIAAPWRGRGALGRGWTWRAPRPPPVLDLSLRRPEAGEVSGGLSGPSRCGPLPLPPKPDGFPSCLPAVPSRHQEGGERAEPAERQAGGAGAAAAL